jgi:hypothetical protein
VADHGTSTTGEADRSPLVTVAIRTYRRPHFLRIAIDSALAQTCRNTERLVSDSEASDDIAALVAGYHDQRLRYRRNDTPTNGLQRSAALRRRPAGQERTRPGSRSGHGDSGPADANAAARFTSDRGGSRAWPCRPARGDRSAVEDFGLTPLEANAFGTPTLPLRAGAQLDSVAEGVSGSWIEEATAESVRAAMSRFPSLDPEQVRRCAVLPRAVPAEAAGRDGEAELRDLRLCSCAR